MKNLANQLTDLQDAFASGEITKQVFIQQACTLHQNLWHYSSLLKNCDVHQVLISETGVEFLLGDERVSICAPPHEARVAPLETLNFGSYEPVESFAMNILASNASVILDIGANIGYHSVRLAKRESQAQVFAFEPMPCFYEFLQRNIYMNSLGKRVVCHNYGLSSDNGSFDFFISPENGTNASLKNVANRTDAQKVVGLTMKLDDWISNHNIKPDFIKIDVEGAELLVLQGALNCLKSDKPKILAELLRKWSAPFGYHPNQVLQLMSSMGYGCWSLGDKQINPIKNITDDTLETNFVFLHLNDHIDTIKSLENLSLKS